MFTGWMHLQDKVQFAPISKAIYPRLYSTTLSGCKLIGISYRETKMMTEKHWTQKFTQRGWLHEICSTKIISLSQEYFDNKGATALHIIFISTDVFCTYIFRMLIKHLPSNFCKQSWQ